MPEKLHALHLVVDNSSCIISPRRAFKAALIHGHASHSKFSKNSEMIAGRDSPKRAPVAHRSGRNLEKQGRLGRATERIKNLINTHHQPLYSRHLNIVKPLEHEQISGSDAATIIVMATDAPTTRNVNAIAERLRVTRDALGLSQAEMCRGSGIATNTYNQWEKGRGRPELDKAILICDAYGLTLDWIYLGDSSGLPYRLIEKIRPKAG
ncbi:helix-turn-helix transcriptional regulator [Pelagibius litoralis]|uniref:Helix-turn-helix transcriptional regulator n=1 Tax=Pelagibius litoralis TaxID=374515 RepID=A0A967EV03_9PROT|nr:helix-turn-helix transcriptional regulator [Pelagibius litoralis]NIA67802.1 helix-turn-helix transcriptional regulator [Pelagibius litoralis]